MVSIWILIQNQWKESVRSIIWHRNLATNIFFGILLFILIINFLSLGIMIDKIMDAISPDGDHVRLFNSWLVYYFLADCLIRYFTQKNPGLRIKPYLGLPIARSTLVHYLLFKSALSFFNIIPLFVFLPFAIKVIQPQSGGFASLAWLTGVGLLIFTSSFLNYYLIRRSFSRPGRLIAYFILVAAFVLLDYYDIINLGNLSAALFGQLIGQPLSVIVPLLLLIMVYRFAFAFFRNNLYLDNLSAQTKRMKTSTGSYGFLENLGETGNYMALEIKLLLRNKRARSSLALAAVMLIVGMFFYFSMRMAMIDYPQPDPYIESLTADQPVVSFRVESDVVPAGAYVYITGDQANLGKWRRNFIPMDKQPDGSWQRRFSFIEGSEVKFKFHLGKWDTERLEADGSIPRAYTLNVDGDTTVTYQAVRWGHPERLFVVDVMLIYMGIIFVGILMLSYGQFMLAWESGYFDLILTRKINFDHYFRAKYLLLVTFGLIMFLLTIPVALLSTEILMINAVLLIYNLGVNTIIMFIMATYTRKRLDLNASIFSTQGKGANQFTLVLPTMILPVLIFLPFALTDNRETGFAVLLAAGIAGLVFHLPLLKWVTSLFFRQKYIISAAFKQN